MEESLPLERVVVGEPSDAAGQKNFCREHGLDLLRHEGRSGKQRREHHGGIVVRRRVGGIPNVDAVEQIPRDQPAARIRVSQPSVEITSGAKERLGRPPTIPFRGDERRCSTAVDQGKGAAAGASHATRIFGNASASGGASANRFKLSTVRRAAAGAAAARDEVRPSSMSMRTVAGPFMPSFKGNRNSSILSSRWKMLQDAPTGSPCPSRPWEK